MIEIKRTLGRKFLPQVEHSWTPNREEPLTHDDKREPFSFEGWLIRVDRTVPECIKTLRIRLWNGEIVEKSTAGEVVLRGLDGTIHKFLFSGLPCGWNMFEDIADGVVPGERIRIDYNGNNYSHVYVIKN